MPRFVSKCPFCDDNSLKYWHHKGCPSEYKEYIDIEGNVTCDCGDKWHLVDMKFYCSKFSCMKNFTKKSQIRTLIMCIIKFGSIDDDFLDELQENVIEKWNTTH